MQKLIQIDFNRASFSVVEVEDSLLIAENENVDPKIYESGGLLYPEPELGFPRDARFIRYTEENLKRLEELNTQTVIIREAGEGYDEDGCPTGDWQSYGRETTLLKFFIETCEECDVEGFNTLMHDPNLLRELDQIFRDCCDYWIGAYTEEEIKAEEAEKKRLKIERVASWWAKQCGYPVGSREYVLSAKRALNDREEAMEEDFNYERRAERFAACRYAGCPDSYWSDEDYIRGKHLDGIEEVGMVLQWLEENCPLLMRQLEEAELATQED